MGDWDTSCAACGGDADSRMGPAREVTGAVNAKVVRVSVELPNGKKGKGMARVPDLEE